MIALYLATGVIARASVVPVGSINTPGGYDFLGRSGKRKREIKEEESVQPRRKVKKKAKAPHEIADEHFIPKQKAAISAVDLREKLASDKAKQKHRARLLSEDDWFILN